MSAARKSLNFLGSSALVKMSLTLCSVAIDLAAMVPS